MRLFLPLPGNESMAAALATLAGGEVGRLDWRRFPDEEAYVRIQSDVRGADVEIVATLARPDPQFLTLVYTATTARELGAASVRLIAPYLAYMRQDARFKDGEAVSSAHFARLISATFDSLVTVDPHLHRRASLSEIYSIPTRVAHAAPLLGDWIARNVAAPLIVGPDRESEQWVAAVAERAGAPHAVAAKARSGDRHVTIDVPDLSSWKDRRIVLIDDVASSGRTLIETARAVLARGCAKPYCAVTHAIFADNSYAELQALSERVVSTDTVPHASNAITVASLLV